MSKPPSHPTPQICSPRQAANQRRRLWIFWSVGVWSIAALPAPATASTAFDLTRPPSADVRAALVAKGWGKAREALEQALAQSYRPGMAGRAGSTGHSAYRQWLALWKWCELLSRDEEGEAKELVRRHLVREEGGDQPLFVPPGHSPGPEYEPLEDSQLEGLWKSSREELLKRLLPAWVPRPEPRTLADLLPAEILESWMADALFSEALFGLLDPLDYAPGVLGNLKEIWSAAPGKSREYAALALALAVVYDQNFPDFWPHPQVRRDAVPLSFQPPAVQFNLWVKANESRALATDLRTLRPRHLKHVVDAPLAGEEWEWARQKARYTPATLSRAFSDVPYATQRADAGEFIWRAPDYTLANILRLGGICVDQAYFAMIAGKARGIPTLFFTGQGTDGGHAWFGFLKTGGRWDMDAGRYENQNYAVGEALDPQTWQPLTDHELQMLAEGWRDSPEHIASRDDLLLAAVFEARGQSDLAAKAYESAVAVSPRSPEAWEARGDYLERTGAPAAHRRAFHEAAVRQFEGRRDLRARHQYALADLAREEGRLAEAEAIEKKIVSQNRMRRADLSVSAAARRLEALVGEKKMEEAVSEFRRLLASLRRTGGGAFFYEVVEPFARVLAAEGRSSKAREIVQSARKALHPSPGSILAREFEALERELAEES